MEFRLPEKVWTGKEVKFSHLKVLVVFLMFILILMLIVNLMQSLKYVFFIGYGDEKFGYRFWDEQNKKIIRSRNVIFNE